MSELRQAVLEAKSIVDGWAVDEHGRVNVHKDAISKAVNAAVLALPASEATNDFQLSTFAGLRAKAPTPPVEAGTPFDVGAAMVRIGHLTSRQRNQVKLELHRAAGQAAAPSKKERT